MRRFKLIVVISIISLSFSCNKHTANAGKEVEIYLLKTYQPVAGKCQVDAATAVLQDASSISNGDIVTYSKTEYTFQLTSNGMAKANTFKDRDAFAVTVDKQVIYYGYFKPAISSSGCPHSITMDNNFPGGSNKIIVNLGYVFISPDIDDQRNNPHLLATLEAQGKLR